MMKRSGSVYAGLTGQKCIILLPANKSIYNFMGVIQYLFDLTIAIYDI
jgi:hypothetical protein